MNNLKPLIKVINKKKNKFSLKDILDRKAIIIFAVLFGFVFGGLMFSLYFPYYYHQRSAVILKINKGDEVSKIVNELYDKDVIGSKFMMRLSIFLTQTGSEFKAGVYKIENGLNYFDLIKLLTDGRHANQKLVTIPEGIWQNVLAGLLQRELGIDSTKIIRLSYDKKFLKSLNINEKTVEGFLLPETYYFYYPASAKKVLQKLKKAQDKLFDEDAKLQMAKLGMNRTQILTIASIIDGESNKTDEFRRIAGVYYNRLKRGMRLQADPTVQYLIRERRRHNKIYYKDLAIKSPYNTYLHYGLPPGPINNPGNAAIEAALYPEKNEYYYFVASGDGGHLFAKTHAEQNRNVQKYRRWRVSKK